MSTLNARGTNVDATNNTTWNSQANAIDGAFGTNNATYCNWTNTTANANAYIEIGNFDFSSIPDGSTGISISVTLRHYESNTTRLNLVTFQPYESGGAIGSAYTCTRATSARSDTTTFTPTLTQLKSASFCIRVNASRYNGTLAGIFYMDYVDITATYTPPATEVFASATFDGTSSFSATGTVEHVVAASASFDATSSFAATGDVTPGGGSTRAQVQVKSATNSTPFTSIGVTMSPAVTAGNVIVAALACDKSAPNITPPGSGWNVVLNNAGTSVSMWVGWKVADGGETTLTWTHDAGTDAAGDELWVAEYSDSGSGTWADLGSASNPSDNSTVTVQSTGTTSATTAIGEALAFFGIDSSSSSTGTSYNNSFTEILAFASSGRGGLAIAHISDLAASTTAECTQTHTGTADQMSAAILVLAKTTGGATTVQATASFSGTSGMTAVGFVERPSSATFAAASAFSSTGFATRLASITYAASSAFSATGFATRLASVTYAASSGFSATGFATRPASVTYTASSTFSATGFATRPATATFTASAGFTAVATVTSSGVLATFELWELGTFVATLGTQTINTADGNTLLSFDLQPYLASLTDNTGSGIELRITAPSGLRIESAEWRSLYLAPQGVVTVQATATFDSTSGFTATGLVTKESSATFPGTATFTAVGTREVTPSVSYAASSTFTATATPVKMATATYAATSTFTAVAIRAAEFAATYSASSTFTATAIRTVPITVAYAATSTFTATGFLVAVANVTYAATSTFTAVASTLGQVDATVTYTSSSTFTATGTKTAVSTALYPASSTFTATATRITFATVSYAASSTFTAVGETIKFATVTMSATSTFVATAFRVLPTQVTYAATSTFSATAVRAAVVAVSYVATSTFTATGLHISVATATYSGVSTFIATGDVGIPRSTNDVWGIEF